MRTLLCRVRLMVTCSPYGQVYGHVPAVLYRARLIFRILPYGQVPAFSEKAHTITLSDEMVEAAARLHGSHKN